MSASCPAVGLVKAVLDSQRAGRNIVATVGPALAYKCYRERNGQYHLYILEAT